ncbi:CYTH domain-containing protein [Chakrabartyella piscis]|uniref:CYTH domain-containing protein n=1 Tax=Chakrabartyella piscis TaxID=2918914 RepID=UPI0029589A06|nr:CYTH domain-containing protein [Chakrabartyella piscis]
MEIERKFLTKEIPFSLEGFACKDLRQSYISFRPTIRIRKSNDTYYLTIKGSGHISREEYELMISEEEYNTLLQKAEGTEICKKRYLIPLEGDLVAELDVYAGELEGLYTTEVEFATEEEANGFIPPDWFGVDVTTEKTYKNAVLAQFGLPKE